MPLAKGCSNKVRSKNIRELMQSGRPLQQAIAISISHAKKNGCKIKPKRKS